MRRVAGSTLLERASATELVDGNGQVRAQLNVDDDDGEVVLRLRDADGSIRVKLGASKDGSGLLLLDEALSQASTCLRSTKPPSL